MLRNAVKMIDKVRPVRSFGDRDEWVKVLKDLHDQGKLIYVAGSDTIELSEAAGPSSAEA